MPRRVLVGATGDDTPAAALARRLRDEGLEVVYVGGRATVDAVAHAALAEDVAEVLLVAAPDEVAQVADRTRELGLDDLVVTCTPAPEQPQA
ncbi:MAG: hypothetical protein PGN07_02795 [Aeromicrobium erythreum]